MARRADLLVVLAGAILLSGCIAEERGHVVKLDKGFYAGPPDTAISDATRLALRSRMAGQSDGAAQLAAGDGPIPASAIPVSGRIAGQNY